MNIIPQKKSIHVDKPDGTSVNYYLFPEYEVHYNVVAPQTTQQWHHHLKITESILILDGQIEVHWVDVHQQKQHQLVKAGDLVEVGNTPHTFVNSSNSPVKFVVFRFVPSGYNQQEVIKNDKFLDNID
ncbi:MAG: cupin domain-containing protein [Microgenomates group bacterium]